MDWTRENKYSTRRTRHLLGDHNLTHLGRLDAAIMSFFCDLRSSSLHSGAGRMPASLGRLLSPIIDGIPSLPSRNQVLLKKVYLGNLLTLSPSHRFPELPLLVSCCSSERAPFTVVFLPFSRPPNPPIESHNANGKRYAQKRRPLRGGAFLERERAKEPLFCGRRRTGIDLAASRGHRARKAPPYPPKGGRTYPHRSGAICICTACALSLFYVALLSLLDAR